MNSVYNVVNCNEDLRSELNSQESRHKESFIVAQPPLLWRTVHCLLCIIGGTTFLLGSIQYLPYFSHEAKGAYLFTIGSFCFFLADLLEFVSYHQLPSGIVGSNKKVGWFARSEDFLNSLMMTTGSLSYFIGCVYFVPQLHHTDVGDILFIPGSVLLFIAEVWRIYRSGSTLFNAQTERIERCEFHLHHITNTPVFCADMSLCLGAVAFLVGSILFLPNLDLTTVDTRRAAMVFILGSALFLQSAICLFYAYFVA